MRKYLSTLLATAALSLAAVPALADGIFTAPGGRGLAIHSTEAPCAATPTVRGCAYMTFLTYRSDGAPVAYRSSGNNLTATTYDGAIVGGGSIRVTQPDPFTGTVSINGGEALSLNRTIIEAGRPGGAFNTVRTGYYAAQGATIPEMFFEVQGSTILLFDLDASGVWAYSTGALTLDTTRATSTYSGNLVRCTVGPACTVGEVISISFPRNNWARVTRANGTVSDLYPLAY